MSTFVRGLELSRLFYREAVKPIVDRRFPDLQYAAALIGQGSEVLGFDTERSTDHAWGPRLMLFLSEPDLHAGKGALDKALRDELPYEFRGYPTNFTSPDVENTILMSETASGPVNHDIRITSLPDFLKHHLGIASYPDLAVTDWLLCTGQALLEVTAGAVYHDGFGEITAMRRRLRYYPHDVWLYLLATQWARIAQVEPFVARCGDVGDEIGSALIAAAQVRDLMRLCFLMERTYPPYPKWFGSAFARLRCSGRMLPLLEAVLRATSWQTREQHLSAAYSAAAGMYNALGITDPLSTEVRRFHDRPYLVIGGERFSRAIRERIVDEEVRSLAENIGSVDQVVDSTDVLSVSEMRVRLRAVYSEPF